MRYKYLLFFMLWSVVTMAQPVVNLGNDTTICSGSITLNAGNAGASFVWSTGETTQTILTSAAGVYWVAVTNGSGTTRDSLTLTIAPAMTFSRPDTVLCSGLQSLTVQGNSSYLYTWFDAATGGNALYQGQTWAGVFNNAATYYIEARNVLNAVFEGFTSTAAIGANSGYYDVTASRGLVFDVLQTAYLISVQLPMTTGNLTGRIDILNASNTVIYSKNVALQPNSSNTISLGTTIPAGTGYRIMFVPVSGTGKLHVSAGSAALPYPYTYRFLRVVSGSPNTTQYNYFYNFQIATASCISARQPFVLTVNSSPALSLPSDSVACSGSVTLDATYPNAAYLWSNGATTATATFTQSQRATVQVLAMGCVGFDTTNLLIGTTPQFSRPDTVTCSGNQTISIAGNNTTSYSWFDAATGGNLVYQGQAWANNFTTSTSYFIEGVNVLSSINEGFTSTTAIGGNSGYYAVSVSRGLIFDVLRASYLMSVQLPMTTGNLSGRIEILNSSNTIIFSKNVTLAPNSSNTISLGITLPVGTGYRMMFVPVSGTGNLHVSALSGNVALPYPYTYNFIRLTNSTPNAGQYNYFYNLQIASNVCQSARQPFNLTVNPSPIVNLPTDTLSCMGNMTLNAAYPNASYLWHNGATAATISLTQSQQASVSVTLAGCTTIDTTNVFIGNTPIFSRADTVTCSGNQTIAIAGDASNFYTWYNAATGNGISYQGQAWTNNFVASTTYYLDAVNPLNRLNEGFASTTGIGGISGFYSLDTAVRGLRFDVLRAAYLMSVQMPMTTGNLRGRIEIYNASNTLIYTKNIALAPNTSNTISLGVALAVGTGYRILFVPTSGSGFLHVSAINGSLPYPYTYSALRLTAGTPNTGQYNYFYNFQLATNVCATTRQPFNLTVNPTPIVNLPADTLSCNSSITIDVTNAGATYLWGDGVTTATHIFAQSEYIDVQVARGQCVAYDTIQIYVRDTAQLSAHDTTLCGGANTLLLNASSAYSYFWWTQPAGGTLVNLGQTYAPNLYDTAVYYVEGRTTLRSYYEGILDTSVIRSSGSGYYAVADMRGTQFNTLSNIILGSVVVYVDGLVTGDVILRNSSGAVLASRSVSLVTGANTIPLNFNIPQGTNYQLLFTNSGGGGKWHASFDSSSVALYPRVYAHVRHVGQVIGGISYSSGSNGRIYSPFYKWEIVETACPTARYPFTVNVLPTPILQFPTDTVICNTSITLNAATPNNAGASYQWSTGQTTAQITVNQSDTVTLRANIGQCADTAVINVMLSNPPSLLNAPNDTTVCGGVLTLRSATDGYTSAWYTVPAGGQPIAFADSINYNIQQTDTLWVEGVGFLPKLNTYGAATRGQVVSSYFVSPATLYATRGLEFDVLNTIKLDQISIFVDAAVRAKIVLQNQYGFEQESQWVSLSQVGENVVSINWIIPQGAGYRLILDSLSGGGVYVMPFNFPLVSPEIIIQRGYPANVSGLYNYFYKWRISTPSCPTVRVPVRITVPPYPVVAMPSDTAVCNASSNLQLTATTSNPNYTYRWNTGATTNTITPTQTGYYEVTVASGGLCTSTSSCFVQYLATPQAVLQNDTTVCASGNVSFLQNSPTTLYNWYNTNGLQVYIGAPYSAYIADSSILVVETAARITTRVGTQGSATPNDVNLYNGFIIPNTFNVSDWAILDSVAVYVKQAPATFSVVLSDTLGRVLATRAVTVTQPYTKTFLPLNFVLRPANGYQLKFDNIGTLFLVNPQATYPATTSAGIATLTGTTIPQTSYACFMDWHFSYASSACVASAVDSFQTTVQIPLSLPNTSAFACASYLADATAGAGASYQWSTGDTTPTALLTSEGLYTVTIADGACVVVDSLVLDQPAPVTMPSGVNCGNTLTNSYTNVPNTLFRWNTGATTGSIYMLGASDYAVTVTTSAGCVLTDSTTITRIEEVPAFDLGAARSRCEGDTITTNLGFYPNLSFRWQNGDTTYFATVRQSGAYLVTVTTPNQCSATDMVAITMNRAPVAAFGISYVNGKTVGISNLAQGLGIYAINYGDNNNYTSSLFHTYANEGCYTITMLVENNCGADTMTAQYATPDSSCVVGVEFVENAANGFEIVPNPNNGEFALQPKATLYDDSDIFIYNMQGVCVWQRLGERSNMPTINATKLPAGAYIVQWRNQQFVQSKRFIVLK